MFMSVFSSQAIGLFPGSQLHLVEKLAQGLFVLRHVTKYVAARNHADDFAVANDRNASYPMRLRDVDDV